MAVRAHRMQTYQIQLGIRLQNHNNLHDVKFMHKTVTKLIGKYLYDEYRDNN